MPVKKTVNVPITIIIFVFKVFLSDLYSIGMKLENVIHKITKTPTEVAIIAS